MKGTGNFIPVYAMETVKMKTKTLNQNNNSSPNMFNSGTAIEKNWKKIFESIKNLCIKTKRNENHYVHNEMWQCQNLDRLPHQVVTGSSQTGSLELLCMHASKLSWRSRSGNFAGFPSKISLWNLCEDHCTSPWQASWPAAKTVADKDCTVFASTEIASS